MAIQKSSYNYIIDALTSDFAGNEFILAAQNAAQLSSFSYNRLVTALTNPFIAADVQAAILGARALSAVDIEYLTDGFSSAAVSSDVVSNILNNAANSINPPISNGMPTGFSIASSRSGTQQVSALAMPAGSAFSSTGVSPYVLISNGGNANQYFIYYNVLGGSNTEPSVPGAIGVEINILASDSAIAIANKSLAAMVAANLIGINSSVVGSSLTVVSGVVSLPLVSLPGGSYSGPQSVSLSSLTPGVQYYYTTNGSAPTLSSMLYTAPIVIGMSETLNVLSILPSGGNSAITSTVYVISGTPDVATHIVFSTEPGSAAQGSNLSPQPIVTIKDASGDTITSGADATAMITLSLASGPGALGGTLSVAAIAGVATFSGISASEFGNIVITATKANTVSGGGTVSFTVNSSIVNISNNLAAVNLGTAANYAILSESGITNTSGTYVTGNMGVSPIASTAITGFSLVLDESGTFSTSSQCSGDIYASDYSSPTPSNLTTAISNMGTAYTTAQGLADPNFVNLGSGEIGGLTLVSGLYKWTTGVTISNNVTISGGPNDVFIFQIAGTLGMAAAKSVILSGGVVASNIFWCTSGAVTIGANAVFNGNILSATAINLQTNAAANGRLLAQTAVTLESNAVLQ